MEKKIGSKEVEMKVVKNTDQPQKLSYEQLNQACAEMSQQLQQQNKYIQQMHKQLQEMSFMLQNKRMEYLFKVVEIAHKSPLSYYACFAKDFVEECIAEIQESLTIPQEEKKEETPKED